MNENEFPTLNRLMEFGMGMGMAQQMIGMMNQSMQSMQIPESARPVLTKEIEWYVAIDGKACGPYSENEMKSLLLDKKVTKESLVWRAGMTEWQTAECTLDLLKLFIQLPPAL